MRHLLFGCILLTSIAVASAALAGDLAKARQELASTGKLRVGVVSAPKADAFFVVKNADDRPRGVTVDLGDELARTLNVSSEFFVAHNSGEITDALEKGLIDVAFMPVDDERRKRVEFGPAYILFESTCLVLGSSDFRAISDLDRAGVRSRRRNQYDHHSQRCACAQVSDHRCGPLGRRSNRYAAQWQS